MWLQPARQCGTGVKYTHRSVEYAESPEINPDISSNSVSTRYQDNSMGENSLPQMVPGQLDIHTQDNEFGPYPHMICKI